MTTFIQSDKSFEIKYIDQSGVCEFSRCPAKYFFNRLLGLRAPNSTNIAPDYGTCMHRALPYCYDGLSNIHKAIDEFKKSWQSYNYGESDPKRNTTRAEASIRQFASTHTPNLCPYERIKMPINAPTNEVISPYEVPFLLDIGGELPIAGRIDVPVKWKSLGSIWALDYKTSQEISSRFFNNFSGSVQVCLYTLALSQITGERVSGMIIEAIRVSETNSESQLSLQHVSDYQLISMRDFVNGIAENLVKCNKEQRWPKHLSACSPYGQFGFPSSVCPYKNLCTVPDWHTEERTYVSGQAFHPFNIE